MQACIHMATFLIILDKCKKLMQPDSLSDIVNFHKV